MNSKARFLLWLALMSAAFAALTHVRVYRYRECRAHGFSVLYCASAQ